MASTDFQNEVMRVIALYKACIEAWRVHPLYDGDSRNPIVRAVCRTRGPESFSFSIDDLSSGYAHFARMARQRITAEKIEFAIEPIQSTDPVDPYRVLDWWRFPTKAGAKYAAKKLFRELFPVLRPALTQACRIIREPARRDPDTHRKEKKEFSFKMWMMRQPKLSKAAFDLLIAPGDIWELANGKLSVDEVEILGIRRFPLIEDEVK